MAEYVKNVFESVYLQDAVTKNLHTCSVGDTLSFTESVTTQHKFVDVAERLSLEESVISAGGTFHLDVSEALFFTEEVHPRVLIHDVAEALILTEFAGGPHLVDERLIITETLDVIIVKPASDILVFAETLGLNMYKSMVILDAINLSEGLAGVLVRNGIPIPITPFYTPPTPYVTGVFAQEPPVGVIDGVNAVFTVSYIPLGSLKLQVYVNGILQTLNVDYTFVDVTITFIAPAIPQVGDSIVAYYVH